MQIVEDGVSLISQSDYLKGEPCFLSGEITAKGEACFQGRLGQACLPAGRTRDKLAARDLSNLGNLSTL